MKELRFKLTIIGNLIYVPTHIRKINRYIAEKDKHTEEELFSVVKEIANQLRKHSHTSTDVYGMEENLPKSGSYIMYANHQGRYDGIGILLSLPRMCSMLGKKSQADRLLTRQVFALTDSKKIDHSKLLEVARIIKEIGDEVSNGRPYLIFPEGYYSDNKNNLQEFKDGCFRCSLKSKTPIVPIVLYDSYKAMNQNKLGRVVTQVHYLKPIPYEEYGRLKTTEIAELVKERMQEKLDEIENGKTTLTPDFRIGK